MIIQAQQAISNSQQQQRMQGKVSERLYKDANAERKRNRENLMNRMREERDIAQGMPHIDNEFEELDYLKLYPQLQRRAIIASLTAPPPDPLPPLDVTTISYYRRLSRPVFQTRQPGSTELDPHLTHESLHLLSMLPQNCYPNFAGLTKEFERDLRGYLAIKSRDIHTMAVIAAGNRCIGREKDVVAMVQADEGAIWVLFNHIFSEKITYHSLLPYILRVNPIAFRAFYELSLVNGHESIAWFFDNDDVVTALIRGLECQEAEVRNLTLRILGNVLGEENEDYVYVLLRTSFLDNIFPFLMSSETMERRDGCWVLTNFCSYRPGAEAVMLNSRITQKLKGLLFYEQKLEIRRQIAHIFSHLINHADKQTVYQYLANREFLEMMAVYLYQLDVELSIITLSVLQEVINLGEEFKDIDENQNEINVVSMMVLSIPDLMGEINQARDHQNCQISQFSNTILNFLYQSERMEGEC